ncbi:MAG: sigma-70 family RNA polymerase sigma factor [Pseudomonadota bacterium]
MKFSVSPTRKHAPPRPTSTPARLRPSSFAADLVLLLPLLTRFSRSLCRNAALADDLVQDACVSAIAHSHSFVRGTNMRAWMFTIVRNQYLSVLRKGHREVEDSDGSYAGKLSTQASQNHALDLDDTLRAMQRLPKSQRETLMLVGPLGLSYDEAAAQMSQAEGTIKSRTHRARLHLMQHLQMDQGVAAAM